MKLETHADVVGRKAGPADAPRQSKPNLALLPPDAPLLSLADAASYLRISRNAAKKRMHRRSGEMGELLYVNRVLVDGRTYIAAGPFLTWLRAKSTSGSGSSTAG